MGVNIEPDSVRALGAVRERLLGENMKGLMTSGLLGGLAPTASLQSGLFGQCYLYRFGACFSKNRTRKCRSQLGTRDDAHVCRSQSVHNQHEPSSIDWSQGQGIVGRWRKSLQCIVDEEAQVGWYSLERRFVLQWQGSEKTVFRTFCLLETHGFFLLLVPLHSPP
jgi:hypothetical protein